MAAVAEFESLDRFTPWQALLLEYCDLLGTPIANVGGRLQLCCNQ